MPARPGMRIIAGSAKGRRLSTGGGLRGRGLRPTAARVRESVFGVLGARVQGARFLDLYAGAGAMGLEALSRGASEAVFVESHGPAARVIEENAMRCGFEARVRVITAPAARGLARLSREGRAFDIVFLDPPYGAGEVGPAMARMAQWANPPAGGLSEGGLVICQHSRHEEIEGEIGLLVRMRRMRFGETIVDCYKSGGEAIGDGTLRGHV